MKYMHFMPVVNNFELAKEALGSVDGPRPVMVIDNSPGRDFPSGDNWTSIRPIVPLGTAQTFNLCRRIAIEQGLDVYLLQHSDAILGIDARKKALAFAETLFKEPHRRWGGLFFDKDAFCVINVAMVKDVGEWDWLRFPFYFLDNDYFRRMGQRGWEELVLNVPVEHRTSSTINSDPDRLEANGFSFEASKRAYIFKWGGEPGSETR